MLDKIKNEIYQNLEELFATAVVDEKVGDAEGYRDNKGSRN